MTVLFDVFIRYIFHKLLSLLIFMKFKCVKSHHPQYVCLRYKSRVTCKNTNKEYNTGVTAPYNPFFGVSSSLRLCRLPRPNDAK